MTETLPVLTLVLGGAASGKSGFAEMLVLAHPGGALPVYLATAQGFDAEMQAKIAAHRLARGPGWVTHEAPLTAAAALAALPAAAPLLLDCATLWLTNLMLAGADTGAETDALLAALAGRVVPVVVVSNEVGQGIVPDNALARRFRNEQGRLNQRLAAAAGLVVLVVAGLPMVLKGRLPGSAA